MPMIDFCAHGTFPLRPQSPSGLRIFRKAVRPRRLGEIGHPAASSRSQRQHPPPSSLDFLWKVSAIPFVSCGW